MSLNVSASTETRYATSGEVQIAYQALGAGPDLVWEWEIFATGSQERTG